MHLISVENLSIGYRSSLQQGLNFCVNKGDLICLQGKNGKGKTTLLKTLLGEIPSLAGEVKISLDGGGLAYLPQILSHEVPLSLTLGEVLESFQVEKIGQELFDPYFLQKKWMNASGGERQKILIIAQLGQQNQILFLDEPFNHIDADSVFSLLKYFRTLIDQEYLLAIVFISHVLTDLGEKLNIKTVELL